MDVPRWALVLVSAATVTAAAAALSGAARDATARSHPSTSASAAPLVGTWSRKTTCVELAAALRGAGMHKLVAEFVVGNAFIPNVDSVDQLADPANPCAGAVPRRHAHFFTKNGEFGSLDWRGEVVDDGRYRIVEPGTVTIFKEFPKVSFRYRIRGSAASFAPLMIRHGCTTFRCGWAIVVAYPGKTWKRVG